MLLEEVDKSIKQRWMTEWALVQPTIKYVFDDDLQPEGEPSYIRLSWSPSESQQTTQGETRKWRRDAMLKIKVNAPHLSGSKVAQALCSQIMTIFEGKRFGQAVNEPEGIVCSSANPVRVGSDGKYVIWVVMISFHFYQTRTP